MTQASAIRQKGLHLQHINNTIVVTFYNNESQQNHNTIMKGQRNHNAMMTTKLTVTMIALLINVLTATFQIIS